MIIDLIKDAVLANIGQLKVAPKGWYKRCCMLCHTQGQGVDRRNRFGIQFNPNTIVVNCFNCRFSAVYTDGERLTNSFKTFLKQINVDNKLIEKIDFEIYRLQNGITVLHEGEEIENKEAKLRNLLIKWQPIDLPEDSLPITTWLEAGLTDPDFMKVVSYALERKIYDLHNFYWSPKKWNNLHQRLIIPYYYKNKIVGFTSRLCFDLPGKEIPKYYQQCPADFVYNLDNQQEWTRKYVIVNEGVLDAWNTDGVATLGEIHQTKIDIINRMQKEIIVCPDRDKSGKGLVDAAIENDWAVSFPNWDPDIKDASAAAAKYGRLLTVHSIIASAYYGKEKIITNWRLAQLARNKRVKYE